MNCPVDGTTLLMSERQGVEIDYCPQCRGVWLDRGELDKLIERSGDDDDFDRDRNRDRRPTAAPTPVPSDWDRPGYGDKPRKKKKWLSEVFDFD